MKRALLYLQSGGPTTVINTSLYGVIKEARKHPEVIEGIYGSLYGIEGLLKDHVVDLNQEDEEQIELLKQTPGAILGSTRYKLSPDITHPDYEKILATVKKHNIGYLLVNGGNDSMDTCHKLSRFFGKNEYDCKVIGIPKTIDNDLLFTDHCLGYPSAAKYVLQTLQDIQIDNHCYDRGKVAIVEVMGRNAGWLTASAALLGPENKADAIFLPEESFDLEAFLTKVKEIYDRRGKAFIVISEGVQAFLPGKNISVDAFNHIQLGGVANMLGEELKERFGIPSRPIEFSLMQRAGTMFITPTDRKEAIKVSAVAVKRVIGGHSNAMVIIKRHYDAKGRYSPTYGLKHLNRIANAERKMPADLIADIHGDGHLMREYLLPLINGEVRHECKDGTTRYAVFKKVKVH